jgi:hypothetical protein
MIGIGPSHLLGLGRATFVPLPFVALNDFEKIIDFLSFHVTGDSSVPCYW